ncbi:MAG: hypothetical protein ACE5OO_06730 [Candidatus Bathyarchaeia archaeon]
MKGRLVNEIMDTRSLNELIAHVAAEITHYTAQREEYSERLGNFLRESEEKYGGEDWFKRLSLGEKLPKGKAKARKKEKGGKKKKKRKKGKESEVENWVPFRSLLLTSSVQGEAELMFDAIEAITAKIEELNEVKASLEELRDLGLGDDVGYTVLIREGVPRRMVIKPIGVDAFKKFRFSRGFTVVQMLRPRPPSGAPSPS